MERFEYTLEEECVVKKLSQIAGIKVSTVRDIFQLKVYFLLNNGEYLKGFTQLEKETLKKLFEKEEKFRYNLLQETTTDELNQYRLEMLKWLLQEFESLKPKTHYITYIM